MRKSIFLGIVIAGVLAAASAATVVAIRDSEREHRAEFEDRLRRWEIAWLDWAQEARLTLKPGRTWQEVGNLLKRKNPTICKTFTEYEIIVQQGDIGVFLTRRAEKIHASVTH